MQQPWCRIKLVWNLPWNIVTHVAILSVNCLESCHCCIYGIVECCKLAWKFSFRAVAFKTSFALWFSSQIVDLFCLHKLAVSLKWNWQSDSAKQCSMLPGCESFCLCNWKSKYILWIRCWSRLGIHRSVWRRTLVRIHTLTLTLTHPVPVWWQRLCTVWWTPTPQSCERVPVVSGGVILPATHPHTHPAAGPWNKQNSCTVEPPF